MILNTLRYLGILPRVPRQVIDDAEMEDLQRIKEKNAEVTAVATELPKRSEDSIGKLRNSIQKIQSSSVFADFERSMRGRHDRNR